MPSMLCNIKEYYSPSVRTNMGKNGLTNRKPERKVGLWIFYICGFFFVSFFIAPLILAEGSVTNISGRANAFDFATSDGFGSSGNSEQSLLLHSHADGTIHTHNEFAWTELDPYTGFIYAFGDLNCHNKHERSWEINGNQMPVCTRDIGIFLGLAIGGFVFSRRGYNRWTIKDTCLSIIPDNWLEKIYRGNHRTIAWIGFGMLFCTPLIVDGFTQLLTDYESNNFTRPLTGGPFGMGLAILIASMYSARPVKFDTASQVELPGGAKFELQVELEQE